MTASTPRTTARPAVGERHPPPDGTEAPVACPIVMIAAIAVASARVAPDAERSSRVATELEFTGVASDLRRAGRDLPASGRPRRRSRWPGRDRGRTRCRRGRPSPSLAVTPGETLRVRVGGWGGEAVGSTPGAGGWNGGGDGGEALGLPGWRPGRRAPVAVERRTSARAATASSTGSSSLPAASGGAVAGSAARSEWAAATAAASSGRTALRPSGRRIRRRAEGAQPRRWAAAPGRNAPDLAVTATAGVLGVGGDGASGGVSGGGGGGGGLYGGGGGGASASFSGGHGGGGSGFGPEGTTFRAGVGGGDGRARISYDPDRDGCVGR